MISIESVREHYHFLHSLAQAKQFQQLTEFEKDHLNRLKVYATLHTQTDPNIFAFGYCAHRQPIANEHVLDPSAQIAS
jgi:NADH dehydrogenase